MELWCPAYVGLGSNRDDPQRQLADGVSALAQLGGVRLVAVSPVYQSAPWGKTDQPYFLNQAAGLLTQLEPLDLLHGLHQIERNHGRDRAREERWGPRTLDLDLIAVGGLVTDEPGLTLPHPRAHERAFVLRPLADIAPDLLLPGYGRVRNLLKVVDSSGLEPPDSR